MFSETGLQYFGHPSTSFLEINQSCLGCL